MKKTNESSHPAATAAKAPGGTVTTAKNANSTAPPPAPDNVPKSLLEDLPPDPVLRRIMFLRAVGLPPAELFEMLVTRVHLEVHSLIGAIETAYAESPYALSVPPDTPPNQHRAHAYMADLQRALQLANLGGQLQEILQRMQLAWIMQQAKRAEEKPSRNRKSVGTNTTRIKKKKV